MIRDKIVFSTTDPELKAKLLDDENLTLEKCRVKCLAAETTRSEVKAMTGRQDKYVQVMQKHSKSHKTDRKQLQRKHQNLSQMKIELQRHFHVGAVEKNMKPENTLHMVKPAINAKV
jgi:hypothetical protein